MKTLMILLTVLISSASFAKDYGLSDFSKLIEEQKCEDAHEIIKDLTKYESLTFEVSDCYFQNEEYEDAANTLITYLNKEQILKRDEAEEKLVNYLMDLVEMNEYVDAMELSEDIMKSLKNKDNIKQVEIVIADAMEKRADGTYLFYGLSKRAQKRKTDRYQDTIDYLISIGQKLEVSDPQAIELLARIAKLHRKMNPESYRDQSNAKKSTEYARLIREIISKHQTIPQEIMDEMAELIRLNRMSMAKHEYGVATFYFKQEQYLAASIRCKHILNQFGDIEYLEGEENFTTLTEKMIEDLKLTNMKNNLSEKRDKKVMFMGIQL